MSRKPVSQVVRELGEVDRAAMTRAIIEAKGGVCMRGHRLTPSTFYVNVKSPENAYCQMCMAAANRRWRKRVKERERAGRLRTIWRA